MPRLATHTAAGATVALAYYRVSKEDQATEGTSLLAQSAQCRRYCAERGFVIDDEFQDVMSGKRDDRPEYQRLLARVRELRREGRAVAVVVAALDRFSRKMLESVRCREELSTLDVKVHGIREGGVVDDFIAHIYAATAQQEVQRLSARIKGVFSNNASNGWFKCSKWQPWGYRSRAATEDERRAGSPKTVIDVDPISAPYAREVFERVAAGEGTRTVANWAATLSEEIRGERPCNGWRSSRGMTRRAIQDMLRNPTYAGLGVNGQLGRWEPIVRADVWQRVQARLTTNRAAPRSMPDRYPLTSFLHCPKCGDRMMGLSPRRYRCRAQDRGAGITPCYWSIDATKIEAVVFQSIGQVLDGVTADDPDTRAALELAWAKLSQIDEVTDDSKDLRRLEQTRENAQRRITTATRRFIDGDIDKAAYDGLVAEEQTALQTAGSEIERRSIAKREVQSTPLPSLEQVLMLAGSWSTILEHATASEVHDVLAAMVVAIVPSREPARTYSAQITWTPLGEALLGVTVTKSG